MNLVIIPFHDWRKSEKEGFRTRDVHFIKAFAKNPDIEKILVINRPSTWLERRYKKQRKIINGKQILKKGRFTLTQVEVNTYVVDYSSFDIFNQILKKHLWFIEKYANQEYLKFINTSCEKLNIKEFYLITNNVFSYKLAILIEAKGKIFDAWDNFLKFPDYKKIRKELENGYRSLAQNITVWSTNSLENINFFKKTFSVKEIVLIKNGVKSNFISGSLETPFDLINIKRPIIGYGGKISYLLNYKLINFVTKENPDYSFVFVGQILDKHVYNNIEKRENVIFLGDKHYSVYSSYVRNFDICIIPYNIDDGQHGGDSMKAYEYLLTNKKVVGTKGNGLLDLEEHLYLVDDEREFSSELKSLINEKRPINMYDHSWESKTKTLIQTVQKTSS